MHVSRDTSLSTHTPLISAAVARLCVDIVKGSLQRLTVTEENQLLLFGIRAWLFLFRLWFILFASYLITYHRHQI